MSASSFGAKANNKSDDPNHVSESPEARKGRRALTSLLQEAGDQVVTLMRQNGATVDEVIITKAQVLNDMVWEMLLYRSVSFPDGVQLRLTSLTDWFEAVKFLYRQVDGPPPAEMGLTLNPNFDPKVWAADRQGRLEAITRELPSDDVLALPVAQSPGEVSPSTNEDLNQAIESAEPVRGTIFERQDGTQES